MLNIEPQYFHQAFAAVFLLFWGLIGAVINSDFSELPPLDFRLWSVEKLIQRPTTREKTAIW